jgi:hypothetical protein
LTHLRISAFYRPQKTLNKQTPLKSVSDTLRYANTLELKMDIFGLKFYNHSTEVVITKLCCALLAVTAMSTSSLLISLHHIPKIQVFRPEWKEKPPPPVEDSSDIR